MSFVFGRIRQNAWLRPAQSQRTELLDLPDNSRAELECCFRDLRLINRYFGGILPVAAALRPLLPPLTVQPEINLLDIASGVADVPLALAKSWTKLGYRVNLVAVDLNPLHITLAQQAAANQQKRGEGPFTFQARDLDIFSPELTALGQFDFVTCSLAFHHFEPEQRIKAVQIMARQSKIAFVVNDLERSWFGYFGAHLLGLTLTRNRLVRHDGPLSVLRSFSPNEMAAMAESAALPPALQWRVKPALFSRLLLVGKH